MESALINCHYPVSADKFVLQYGIIVKKSDTIAGAAADELARTFGDFTHTPPRPEACPNP